MSTINFSAREINFKIVYYGPGLSGKTTNLKQIYEQVPAESKGEMVSLATEDERTLFFDFLPLDLGKIRGFKTRFHLYTVPGQVFYNSSRKLILRGVDGVVFVADSSISRLRANAESLRNLRENLTEYNLRLGDTVDWWRVEKIQRPELLLLFAEMRLPGRAWLEYELETTSDNTTTIRQTAMYDPVGLPGILYWYAVSPFHYFLFGGMLREIKKAAESSTPSNRHGAQNATSVDAP